VRRSISQHDELLQRAWALPSARKYAPLINQSWKSICGPTSAANVLRSIGVKTGHNPFDRFGVRAMSLDQLAEETAALVPSDWRVTTVRVRDLDAFREQLRLVNEPRYRFIANFSRAPLFGHGGGHHSPLGGWLEREDLVFVLDVNASYGPWLTSAEALFSGVNTFDRGDGQSRGLVRLEHVA
jgi:hypothetical protein